MARVIVTAKEAAVQGAAAAERWIGISRRARAPRLRVIAFPYAGGGASAYRRWPDDLADPDGVDFVAVQLPGRETRFQEPACSTLEPLLEALEGALEPLLDLPFVLFGYSMGAVLAYELTLRFSPKGRVPRCLVVAARTPPHRMRPARYGVELSKDALVARVRRLGGTAPQVLDSALFDEHFLPTLQADFAVVDGFSRVFPHVVPCPVLALGAVDDPEVPVEHTRAWEAAAGRGFRCELFEGGHFFLHGDHIGVIERLNPILLEGA